MIYQGKQMNNAFSKSISRISVAVLLMNSFSGFCASNDSWGDTPLFEYRESSRGKSVHKKEEKKQSVAWHKKPAVKYALAALGLAASGYACVQYMANGAIAINVDTNVGVDNSVDGIDVINAVINEKGVANSNGDESSSSAVTKDVQALDFVDKNGNGESPVRVSSNNDASDNAELNGTEKCENAGKKLFDGNSFSVSTVGAACVIGGGVLAILIGLFEGGSA